jgi:hypothetical protein
MIGTKPHLVTPVNQGFFLFGSLLHQGIIFL